MASITSFPIVTTDRKANEGVFGLCPALCGSISVSNPSASAVVSEYGIRSAINDKLVGMVDIHNAGTGTGFGYAVTVDEALNSAVVNMSPLTGDSRFTFETLSGNLVTISYDGSPAIFNINANNTYVQGGRSQMTDTFGIFPGPDAGGNVSGFIYLISGTTWGIPICANMQYSLSGSQELSALSMYEYNKDIAIGKIGIRIPYDHAFPISDSNIYLGTLDEPEKFGYFRTKVQSQIANDGEWAEFIYSPEMMRNQYCYFQSPCTMVAYTRGIGVSSGTGIGLLPCVPVMGESKIMNNGKWSVNDDAGGIFWGYAETSKDSGGKTYSIQTTTGVNNPYDLNGEYNPIVQNLNLTAPVKNGWYHLFDRRMDRQPSDWKCHKSLVSGTDRIRLNICFSNGKILKTYVMKTGCADDAFAGNNFHVTNCPMSWTIRGGTDGDVNTPPTTWTDIATVTNGIAGNGTIGYGNGFMEGMEHCFELQNSTSYMWYQFEFTHWNMTDGTYGMQLGKLELYEEDTSIDHYIRPVSVLPNFALEESVGHIGAEGYTKTLMENDTCRLESSVESINMFHSLARICDRTAVLFNTYEWETELSSDLPVITVNFKDSPRRITKYSIMQSVLSINKGADPMSWNFEARNGTDPWTVLQIVDIDNDASQKFPFANLGAAVTDGNGDAIDDHAYQTYSTGDYGYLNKIIASEQRYHRVKRTFLITNATAYDQYRLVVKKSTVTGKKNWSLGELELFEGLDFGGSSLDLANTRFEARVFYDQVEYSSDTTYNVHLSALNIQSNRVSETMGSDGEVEIGYLSGNWVMDDGYVSTMYNVSADTTNPLISGMVFYGQKGDNISFPVNNGDVLHFYMKALSAQMVNPQGHMDLQYYIRQF